MFQQLKWPALEEIKDTENLDYLFSIKRKTILLFIDFK